MACDRQRAGDVRSVECNCQYSVEIAKLTPSQPQDHDHDSRAEELSSSSNVLPSAGLLFLTFSVASSAYSCRHDGPALAFVLFCYVDLLSLFFCLKRFEKLGPHGPPATRLKLKTAIWALATALNLAFAWRVSQVMPGLLAAVVVWSLAATVALGGFYGMLVYEGDVDVDVGDHS